MAGLLRLNECFSDLLQYSKNGHRRTVLLKPLLFMFPRTKAGVKISVFCDIGMVYFRGKFEEWDFDRVVFGKDDENFEETALVDRALTALNPGLQGEKIVRVGMLYVYSTAWIISYLLNFSFDSDV